MQKPPFGIRELAERAKQIGGYDLAQGVIDTTPPQILIDVLKKLPLEKYSIYNNRFGVLEYREALSNSLKARSWDVPIENIMASAGAMGAITAALLSHCKPGDQVLLPSPMFVYHSLLLKTLHLDIEYYDYPITGNPDWNDLAEKFSSVQAAIITTPANPTGQVANAEVLAMLSKQATKANCLLIIDEMYREFIWDDAPKDDSGYSEVDLANTVIIRSFSKYLAIPGWRVGFAISNKDRIEKMAPIHDVFYVGGSTIGQHAIAETLTNHQEEIDGYISALRTTLLENRASLTDAFKAYGMNPLPVSATYYMLIEHNRKNDMVAMEELLEKKIVVTPASILFNDPSKGEKYIRIHFGVSPKTAQAVVSILT